MRIVHKLFNIKLNVYSFFFLKKLYILILLLLLSSTTSVVYSQILSWEKISNVSLNNLFINDKNIFYGTSNNSVLISTDSGLSWDSIYTSPLYDYVSIFIDTNFIPNDRIILYEYSSNGCWYRISFDNGLTWQTFNPPYTSTTYFKRFFSFDSNGNIYFMGDTLHISSDNGVSWEDVNIPAENKLEFFALDIYNNLYVSKRWISYMTPPYSYSCVYKSSNLGASWENMICTETHPYNGLEKLITNASGEVFAENSTPLARVWHVNRKKNYLHGYDEVSVESRDSSEIYVSGEGYGNFTLVYTLDGGTTWITDTVGLGVLNQYSFLNFDRNGSLYLCNNNGIFKSPADFYCINRLDFGTIVLGDTSYISLYLSNEHSYPVIIDSISLNSNSFFFQNTGTLVIPGNDSIEITVGYSPKFFGLHEGKLKLFSSRFWKSIILTGNSPGASFHVPYFEIPINTTLNKELIISNNSPNNIIIDSIYLFDNIVFNLEPVSLPLYIPFGDSIPMTLSFTPTQAGIFYDSIKVVYIPSNSSEYITVSGLGYTVVDMNHKLTKVPLNFNLFQNYPNPFNPSTTIKYSVPLPGKVVIKVYDVLGKEVKLLINEHKSAGTYEIEFNGSELPSGIYFYRIITGNYLDTRKMLLMR